MESHVKDVVREMTKASDEERIVFRMSNRRSGSASNFDGFAHGQLKRGAKASVEDKGNTTRVRGWRRSAAPSH